MRRCILALFLLCMPLSLTACQYGEQPVRVPNEQDPGKYKSCPRGHTTC